MLSVTKEQVGVFRELTIEAFVDKMIVHLNKCFPDKCEEVEEPKLRQFVRYGIQRAASYGISGQNDVCKYVDLMMTLGEDFDSDPGIPWASDILNDSALPHPSRKVWELRQAAMHFLEEKSVTHE